MNARKRGATSTLPMRWFATFVDEDGRDVTVVLLDHDTFTPVATLGEAVESARRSNLPGDQAAPRVYRRPSNYGVAAGPAIQPAKPNRWADPIAKRAGVSVECARKTAATISVPASERPGVRA